MATNLSSLFGSSTPSSVTAGTTTTSEALPDWLQEYTRATMAQGTGVFAQPFQQYQGQRIAGLDDWSAEALEASLKEMAEHLGLGLGKLAQPLRAALTGQTTSPGIFDVLALLGRDESLARIAAQAVPADAPQI